MADTIYKNESCYLEFGEELHNQNLAPLGLAASGVYGWSWVTGHATPPPGLHLEAHYDEDAEGRGKPGVYLRATGTPTEAGMTTVTLRSYQDHLWPKSDTLYKEVSVIIYVRNVVITASPELPSRLIVGQAIAPITISSSGGDAPYRYHFGSEVLPDGLAFDHGTLTLSGTPKKTGAFSFRLAASDKHGIGGNVNLPGGWKKFEGVIEPEITVTGNPDKGGVAGETYYDVLSAKGGAGSYTFVKGDEVPDGVTLGEKTGSITWPSPTRGRHTFWLGAHDGQGNGGTKGYPNGWLHYTVEISPEPDISISPPTSLKGRAGYSYNGTVHASGGHSPYKYELGRTNLSNAHISESGYITGIPHARGLRAGWLNVEVTDAKGHPGHGFFELDIESRLSFDPRALPHVVAGHKMEARPITASGGVTRPYEYTAQKRSGPGGVDIHATDEHVQVSGTPDGPGTIKFQVTAQDSSSYRYDGEHEYELVVEPVVTISPTTLPNGIVGQTYPPKQLQASGDHGSYTFDNAGELPPGLAISGSGEFTGKPTKVGTYNFQLGVKECSASFGSGTNGWRSYTVEITAGLDVSFEGPLTGQAGQHYSGHIRITGGTGKHTVEVLGLSHGLSQKDNTAIDGTPTGEGTVDCTIVVTDGEDRKIVPVKITIKTGSAVDLAISGQRGHFLPTSDSAVDKLTITGHVAGGGLSDTTGVGNIKLKIKVPGKDFVDANTVGKLEWGTWGVDGYGFTLSDIRWQPATGVPRYEIIAELAPQHRTKSAAIVKFPIKEFVRNLAFRAQDGEESHQIAVIRGSQTLTLHMAFYNALDDLTLQLRLPNGVTADKAKLVTHDSALPAWLQFQQDWDGHDKPELFTIKKDPGMKIDPKAPGVNLNVPIFVAPGFRAKEVAEAVAELTSKSDIVEHIINNTEPDRATVGLSIPE